MSFCPHCGRPTQAGAATCPACGRSLAGPGEARAAAMTLVAGSVGEPATIAREPGRAAARTIVGLPPAPHEAATLVMERAPVLDDRARTVASMPTPPSSRPAHETLPGGRAEALAAPSLPRAAEAPRAAATTRAAGGKAVRALAKAPDEPRAVPERRSPPSHDEPHELGATVMPGLAWKGQLEKRRRPARVEIVDAVHRARVATKAPRRVWAAVIGGGSLAFGAVLFAVLWPSAPLLSARVRTDTLGREIVEIRCASCADGTKLSTGGATAVVTGQLASIAMARALSIGANVLPIGVDRPGGDRDETVSVELDVAYRIRPELSTLQGERPAIQIDVEAAQDSEVTIDDKAVALTRGKGALRLDVTEACTGLSDAPAMLSRTFAYTIKPAGGAVERGTVSVSVGVTPLRIDAPGPHATVEGKSFVLAGRTAKGAEVLAAGRPIPVRSDGTFAQVMNVSSVGATEIEVRARMSGQAPRLTRIGVRRVESLAATAAEIEAQRPLRYGEMARDVAAHAGKVVVVGGEVVESRTSGHQTVLLLAVDASFGCAAPPCIVRLVRGSDSSAKPGDLLRAYGRVTSPVSHVGGPPGVADGAAAEIQVDFTLAGLR